MPSFSVSQLKTSASSLKNSSSEKFSNVKSKYSSKPSVNATYDPRVPGSKAPPPPPPPPPRQADQEELEGYDNDAETYDEETPLPTGPPPVIPRHSKPVASSNPILSLNGHQLPSSLNQGVVPPVKKDVGGYGQTRTDSFETSHPGPTSFGSSAQDLCMYFSSSTQWDSAWYATPSAVPPPLENSRDCHRSHYTQWRGDMHTLAGGALFSDLSACWYVVEWSKRNAQNTSAAKRRATVLPRPEPMSRDELVLAHETYGETIAAFAENYEGTGQWCARGECWDLASEALKSFEQWDYVPKPIPSLGLTHGHMIYEGKAWGKGQAGGRWRGGDDRIRRGDIVQWKTTKIVDGYATSTLGAPDHTAVIVKDQIPRITPTDGASMKPGDLVQLEVVEQSVHSPPKRAVYRLQGMSEGELWIYRPVGMEAYLKLIFTPNWPEGMEALVEV